MGKNLEEQNQTTAFQTLANQPHLKNNFGTAKKTRKNNELITRNLNKFMDRKDQLPNST